MSGELDEILDIALERVRDGWSQGNPVSLEHLIAEHDALDGQFEALIDLVYAEVLVREELGEHPAEQEYIDRFPYLTELLHRQFQFHRLLGNAARPNASVDTDDGGETIENRRSTFSQASVAERVFPGFSIESIIGRGGSGILYRARDQKLGRTVVIKLLLGADPDDEIQNSRLIREAEAAASLTHAAIVPVYQVGESDGVPFLVMEFIDGQSLAQRLRNGPLSFDEAVKLMIDIGNAIQYAHSQRVIHRDLKPGNILLNASQKAQVCDFGLARRMDSDQTLHSTGDVIGTPAYMPPEQAYGLSADERSDVYSLGAVLYECLSGRSPFQAATPWDILHQVTMNDPAPLRQLNSSIPLDLETICQHCLEKDPARRYQTAQQLVDELMRFQNGEPILARPVGRMQQLFKWCARQPLLATLVGTSLGLLLLLAVGSSISAFQLSRANGSILHEQKRVEAAEQRAIHDRNVAVDSLDDLVDSLYDDLSSDAATIKTRKKVVEAVISGLSSLTQIKGDAASDRTALKAYSRIAELYSLQGLTGEAEDAYDASIELARSLAKREPDDPTAQRRLAMSLDQLAIHYARSSNYPPMTEITTESQWILTKLLSENPNDVASLRQLVSSHSRNLDYLWQNSTPEKSLELTKTSIADVNRLLKLEDDKSENYVIANGLHSRLGRSYLESGNLLAAETEFDLARQRINRAVELAGDDPKIRFHSAVTDRMRGVLLNAIGKQNESLESLGLALETFESLAQADPEDRYLQQNVGNTLLLTVPSEVALGNFEQAIIANQKAIEIYDDLLQNSNQKTRTRSLLVQAYTNLGDLHLRMRRWDDVVSDSTAIIAMIDGDQDNPPLETLGFDAARSSAKALARSVVPMIGSSDPLEKPEEIVGALIIIASIEASDNEEETLSESALGYIARVNPDLGLETLDELIDHVNSMSKTLPSYQMTRDFLTARVLARRATALANSNPSDSPDVNSERKLRVNHYNARAIELLVTFANNFPAVAFEIQKEPDFILLRETPEFNAKLK